MTARPRLAILISGRGSNMKALLEAARAGGLVADPVMVLADRDAAGLATAKTFGVPTEMIPYKTFPDRERFEDAVCDRLAAANVSIVALAGFMRILSPRFFSRAANWAVLNIHPSLLPSFKGLHPQRQALEAGVRVSGCTVHLVTPELDDGPIIVQRTVPVEPSDTEEILAARIIGQEHHAYIDAVNLVAASGWRVEGRRFIPAS